MPGNQTLTTSHGDNPAMRLMRVACLMTATGLGTLALAGCYESPDATVYEAGDYKGEPDPLVEKLRSEEVQETLAERIETGQTDR